ncbi:hypothetical protein [Spirochaeta thermophila]|uniref:Uncharacterized protein n=1 Tax=Winmispira thermophila (strain ATCC 49972 / DSM 6192 / RI 19.B1) TaxID=665571 RepID=E0RPE5_WINT6|nr:hypothetical protein [Spirochaeta thermophila]ADN02727.1 hypothetical protein STHERM_c17920 [Spirochaeta thermophila DSM 6192]
MRYAGRGMLREIRHVRQEPGVFRRWFQDEYFDLIVWYRDDGPPTVERIVGFQLCYDRQGDERAFTWQAAGGWSHMRVDGGDVPFSIKQSPVLMPDGEFRTDEVLARFLEASTRLEPQLVRFIVERMESSRGGRRTQAEKRM